MDGSVIKKKIERVKFRWYPNIINSIYEEEGSKKTSLGDITRESENYILLVREHKKTSILYLIPKPLQSVLFKSLIVGMLLSSTIIKSIFSWILCKIHNTPYKILLTFMILHEWYGMELNFNPFMNSKAITKRSIYTILLVCYCLQQSWDLYIFLDSV